MIPVKRALTKSALITSVCVACIFSGCATKQDVRPLYDAAIQNFETAQKLESSAIDVSVDARISEIKVLFGELKNLAINQMQALIVTRWENQAHNFKTAERTDTWRSFFGLRTDAEIPQADLIWSSGALDKQLSVEFWTVGGSPVTGYDILVKPNGIDGFTGAAAPTGNITELKKAYAAWHDELNDGILGRMPVIKSLEAAETALLNSLSEERKQRHQTVNGAYGNLIQITSSARAYAGTLTDNAQIIGLANSILKSANGALGKLSRTENSE